MRETRNVMSAVVTAVAVLILLAAIPWALRDTFESGRIHLFSRQFLDELPRRFCGPGRLRFVLQPLLSLLLGCRDGVKDARAGRPAYIYGLLASGEHRAELLRSGWRAIRDLVAMGIVMDAVAQLMIYRQLHPGAALVVGPTMIGAPYALARGLSNRLARLVQRGSGR